MTDVDSAKLLLKKWLAPFLTEQNIKDYSVELDSGSEKGDGYLGDIWGVKVQHENGNIDLVVKAAAKDDTARKVTVIDCIFKNEVTFYTKISSAMNSLQQEKQVSEPFKITKCYASSLVEKEEALVLENLKTKGFSLYERRKAFDKAHVILTLDNYAKYHALSFALRVQRPEMFKELASQLTDIMSLFYPNIMAGLKKYMRKCVEMLKRNGLTEEAKAAEKIAEEPEKVLYLNEKPPDEYTVITHGDCWSNNMMFKYDVIKLFTYFKK